MKPTTKRARTLGTYMASPSLIKDTLSHSGRTVKIPRPQPGGEVIFTSSPSGDLLLDFDPGGTAATREGNSLIFTMNDGGKITIEDFFAVGNSLLPTFILPDGTRADGADYLRAQYPTLDLTTAVGTPSPHTDSGGEGEYMDTAGDLLHGVDKLHDLGTTHWSGCETSTISAFSPNTSNVLDSGSAATGVAPSPSAIPLYNARAVLYTQNTVSLDSADYNMSLKGLSVSGVADCCWSDPTADYAGYLTLSVDGSGSPVLTLTQAGLDALSNNGPNIYGYLNVSSGGTDYTVQVVVNQTNDLDSPTEDAKCLTDCGALPAGLIHGEWHEGVTYRTGVNRIDSSGLGDRIFFSSGLSANGSGAGNDIHTHTQTGKIATVNAGTAASSCAVSATNGGSNTIDGDAAGGDTNVVLTAALGSGTGMYAGQDAENHIVRAATAAVTAKDGMVAENDGLNTLDAFGAVRLAVVTAGLNAVNGGNEISAGGDMTVIAVNTTAAEASYGMRTQATSGAARNTVALQNDKTLTVSVDSTMGAAVGMETRANAALGTASATTDVSGAGDLNISVTGKDKNIGIHTEAGAVNSSASTDISAGAGLNIVAQAKNATNTVYGVATESLGNAAPARTNLQAEDISITVTGNAFSDDAKGLHTEGTGARATLTSETAAVDATNLKSNAFAVSAATNGVNTITTADATTLNVAAKLNAYGMRANAGGINIIDSGEAALTVRGDGQAKAMWAGAGGKNSLDAVGGIELNVTGSAPTAVARGMDVDGDTSVNAITGGSDIAISVTAGGSAIGMRASDKGTNTVDAAGDLALGAHSTAGAAYGMFAETKAKNTIDAEGAVSITAVSDDHTARVVGTYVSEGENRITSEGDIAITVGDTTQNRGAGAKSVGIYSQAEANGSNAFTGMTTDGKLSVSVEADAGAQGWIYGVRTYNGVEASSIWDSTDYDRRAETELKAAEVEISAKGGAFTEFASGVASSGQTNPLAGDYPGYVYTRAHTSIEANSVTVAAEAMNAAGKAHGLDVIEFSGIDIAANELSVSAKAGKEAYGIYSFGNGAKPDSPSGADTKLPEAQRGYVFGAHIAGTSSNDSFTVKAEAEHGKAGGIQVTDVGRVTFDGGAGDDTLTITATSRDELACGIHAGLLSPKELVNVSGSQFGQSGTVDFANVEHVVIAAESTSAGAYGIQSASRDGGVTIRVSGSDALTAEITATAQTASGCSVGMNAHVGENKILGAAGDDSITITAVNKLAEAYGLAAHNLGLNLIDTGAGHDTVVVTAKGSGNSGSCVAAGMFANYAGKNTITTEDSTVSVSAEGSRYNHAMKVLGAGTGGANLIHDVRNGDAEAVALKADKGAYNSVMNAGYGTNTVENISGKVLLQALNGSISSVGMEAFTSGENIIRNVTAKVADLDDAVVRIEATSGVTGTAYGMSTSVSGSKNTISGVTNTEPGGYAVALTALGDTAAAMYAGQGVNRILQTDGTVLLTAEGGATSGRGMVAAGSGLNYIGEAKAVRIEASTATPGTAVAMAALGPAGTAGNNLIEDTAGGIVTESVVLTATNGDKAYGMYADVGENKISTLAADISIAASGGVTANYGMYAQAGGKNYAWGKNVAVTVDSGDAALKALSGGLNHIATSDADARVLVTGDVVSAHEGAVTAGKNLIVTGSGHDFVNVSGALKGDRAGSGWTNWGSYTYSNEIMTGAGNDTVALTGGTAMIDGTRVDLGAGNNLAVVGPLAAGTTAGGTVSMNPSSWGASSAIMEYSEITSGAGNDTILIHGEIFNTRIATAAGDDVVCVSQDVAGKSLIDVGTGNNAVTIRGSLDGSYVQAGNGNDTLTIALAAPGTAAVAATIDMGDGNNVVSLSAPGATGNALIEGSLLYTGSGNDAVTLTGKVGGLSLDSPYFPTTVRTGSGSDTVTLNGKTTQALIALGNTTTGADTAGLSDYNHLNIYGNVGNTKIYGTAGRDDVIINPGAGDIAAAVISVAIDTGGGRDRVYINGAIETSILNGGAGHDTFAFTDNTTVDAPSAINSFEALHFVHLGDAPTAGTLFGWEGDSRFTPYEIKNGLVVNELGYEITGNLGTSGAPVTVAGCATATYARFLHVSGFAWADIEMSNLNDTVAIDRTFNGSVDAGAGDDYIGVGVFGSSVALEGGTGMDTLALSRFGASEGFNYGMDELLHNVSISGFEVLDITYSANAPRAITFDAKVSDFAPEAHLNAGLFSNDGNNTLETILTNASAVLRLVGDADDTINLVGYTAYSGPDAPSVTYQGVAYNVYEDVEHNYLLISKNILDIAGG